MNKTFTIGEEYQALNEEEGMSWNNTLKCVSRSDDMAEFEEIDENDNVCGKYNLFKKKKLGLHDSIEYCEIMTNCIVMAD